MRSARFGILILLAACQSRVDLRVPDPPKAARSVVVAIAEPDDPIAVYVGASSAFSLPAALEDGDEVFVAFYTESLEELGIDATEAEDSMRRVLDADEGMKLAPFASAAHLKYGVDDELRPADATPDAFTGVRVRTACRVAISPPLRFEGGRCSDRPEEPVAPEVVPDEPAPPLPPVADCTNGAVRDDTLGIDVCRPYDPPAPACAAGERLSLPDGACVGIGPASCGDWPDVDPNAIHVDPSAAAGGDGSRARPFSTIAAALATSMSGDTIALARGTHVAGAELVIGGGVRLAGACAAETFLESAARVVAFGPGVTVDGLTLRTPSLEVDGTADLALRDAIFEPSGIGFIGYGGARFENVLVDGASAAHYTLVAALGATASLELADVAVRNVHDHAVFIHDGAGGEIRRLVVRDARVGVYVAERAAASFEDLLVERARIRAIHVANGTATIVRAALRDPGDDDPGSIGHGLLVTEQGTLTATAVAIERARDSAIVVIDAEAELSEISVDDTVPVATPVPTSVYVLNGGVARVRGLRVSSAPASIWVQEGSELRASDVVLDGSITELPSVPALFAIVGSTVAIERALVVAPRQVGVRVDGPATNVTLNDVDIRGATIADSSSGAMAIHAYGGGAIRGARVRVADVPGRALYVTEGGDVDLTDLTVERITHPFDRPTRNSGNAIEVTDTGRVRVERGAFVDCGFAGVFSWRGDTTLEHVLIRPPNPGSGLMLDGPDEEKPPVGRAVLRNVRIEYAPPDDVGTTLGPNAGMNAIRTSLDVERLTIVEAVGSGLFLTPDGADVRMDQILVRGVRGTAMRLADGAPVISNVLLTGNRTGPNEVPAGLLLRSGGAQLTTFAIRDTRGVPALHSLFADDSMSAGVVLEDGRIEGNDVAIEIPTTEAALLTVRRLFLRDNETDITTYD